ncbi:hypothetical protein X777_15265 [Ooceraea biroi]|uniref:Uncharacterized protein n=1 Tax=Ooceraea biroi TaxID=2015173 RepID=A0A026VY75_OOCBI|nr:hypothetical protein X777_15265 [Ooceraea biroi]
MSRRRAMEEEGRRRTDTSQQVGRVSPAPVRARGASAGKRESAGWKEQGERVETHILPTPATSTTSWLATLLPPRGRVICEKHVDPREEEGRPHSFISSYISCKRLSLLPRREKRTADAGESSRWVAYPRLYAGATTQPDCGPSGFRSEFSRRAPTAQRARPRCRAKDSTRRKLPKPVKSGSSLAVPIVQQARVLLGIRGLDLIVGVATRQDRAIGGLLREDRPRRAGEKPVFVD